MPTIREQIKYKQRIVVKIGSSSLVHTGTKRLNYTKMERLVRFLCDLRNQGKDVILVTSGSIAVGSSVLGLENKPRTTSLKQACAAIGQGQLMMTYQKLFAEYHHSAAQVLLTLDVVTNEERRRNATNTFNELLQLGVIPVVNENDTVAVEEIEFGDNDSLSAIVTALVGADCLVILSDIDGLYTDDPHINPEAKLIDEVEHIDESLLSMAKDSSTNLGTGGMLTKLRAAKIATRLGAVMAIINGRQIENLMDLFDGLGIGTVFHPDKKPGVTLDEILKYAYFDE